MRVQDQRDIRNKPLKRIRVLFVLMFVGLIANILYFVVVQSEQMVINDYNPRLEEIEAGVLRGDILDRNGKKLATSIIKNDVQVRRYPYGNIFAHSVGYINIGKTGLEGYNNLDLIRSNNTFKDQLTSTFGRDFPKGNSVITTFDAELQSLASELLGENKGAIVAMNPMTGEILAMVSKPDFDPNNIVDGYDLLIEDPDNAPLLNRVTQGLYPPGSTYKTITTIAYLEKFKESDFFNYCEGEAYVGQKVIHCYDNHAHGRLSLDEAFAQSCNTSYGKMAEVLDGDRLKAISEQFLFNEELVMELPTNASQFVLTSSSSPNEMVETVIGQGKTLITPLNNVLIASAIANNGAVYHPIISKSIVSDKGIVIRTVEPEIHATIMTPAMAEKLEGYMKLTSETGTAKSLDTEDYQIASKTGTAENSQGKDHAWYIGYAPIDNPKIAIAVIVENAGSSTRNAVPIADALYQYYLK